MSLKAFAGCAGQRWLPFGRRGAAKFGFRVAMKSPLSLPGKWTEKSSASG